MEKPNIILYQTKDGKAAVSLYAREGTAWMNQAQIAELFATSVPNISMHVSKILRDGELSADSVVKHYLTTAADGNDYRVGCYALGFEMNKAFCIRSECLRFLN